MSTDCLVSVPNSNPCGKRVLLTCLFIWSGQFWPCKKLMAGATLTPAELLLNPWCGSALLETSVKDTKSWQGKERTFCVVLHLEIVLKCTHTRVLQHRHLFSIWVCVDIHLYVKIWCLELPFFHESEWAYFKTLNKFRGTKVGVKHMGKSRLLPSPWPLPFTQRAAPMSPARSASPWCPSSVN